MSTALDDLVGAEGAALDRLARLAARVIGAPLAAVSLVAGGREAIASRVGPPEAAAGDLPPDHPFSRHVAATREPLVVPDARRHLLLRDHPAPGGLPVAAASPWPPRSALARPCARARSATAPWSRRWPRA